MAFRGFVFADSDVYKVLEGASMILAEGPDAKLEAELDSIINLIASAQIEDGYLNTFYRVNKPDKRFSNLRDDHELYCAGHLIEAAVAHYEALGKRNLLDIAIRFADLLCGIRRSWATGLRRASGVGVGAYQTVESHG